MKAIGVFGQARNGKSVTAKRLVEKLGSPWKCGAFAFNVKKTFCDTFDVDMDFVEKWKVIDEPPPGYLMTVRKALQFIGDGFRQIKSDIWLDLTFRTDESLIIEDGRYINEFTAVKNRGGINVLIGRPDKLNDDPNGSEAQIKPFVEWCLRTCPENQKLIDFRKHRFGQGTPVGMDKIDFFIRNDGDMNDLYRIIDNDLVPRLAPKESLLDFAFNPFLSNVWMCHHGLPSN